MNSDLSSFDKIEQKIGGSRKISNYIIGGMLTIGGIGFLLASISSYTGRDLLPLGNPSTLLFVQRVKEYKYFQKKKITVLTISEQMYIFQQKF